MLNNPIFLQDNIYKYVDITYCSDKRRLTFINPNFVNVMMEIHGQCLDMSSLLQNIRLYYNFSIPVIETVRKNLIKCI